ncbi:MFS transporter [Dactylosporangium sp. CS-033363]|uniref:MFS transporter n=1 Tax=Dactylosporangium sp. CS-033363 TaxID=3239935 RepID=UPI003D8EE924
MPPYWPVVRNRVFARLLPGLAVSALGDGMSAVAIGWLALQVAPHHQRGLWVGLAIAAYTLPGALGAVLLARPLRGRSGAHLAALDAALRTVFLGAIPLLAWSGALTIGRYTALLACSALLSAWGSAGRYTLVAQVLPSELHVPANALLTVLTEASTVAGPMLAGLLIAWFDAAAVLAADAVTFAVLAVSFALVRNHAALPERERRNHAALPERERRTHAALPERERRSAGLAAIRRDRRLFALMALSFWFFLLFGPVPVAVPLFANSAQEVALLYTAFGVGAVIGAVATGHLPHLPLWPASIGSVLAFGLLLLPLGLSLPRWADLLTLALAGLAWAPYPTASMSIFQRLTPAACLPSVLAARGAVLVVSTPLGTLLGAPLVQATGPAATLVTCGVAIAVLGLVAVGVRLFRPLPRARFDERKASGCTP